MKSHQTKNIKKDKSYWNSVVLQWIRICLPMWGTWVPFLVQENSICHEAIKAHALQPLKACTIEPTCHNYGAHRPRDHPLQQEKTPQ